MKQEKRFKIHHNTQADVSKSIILILAASLLFVTGCKKELVPNTAASDEAISLAIQSKPAKAPTMVVQTRHFYTGCHQRCVQRIHNKNSARHLFGKYRCQ